MPSSFWRGASERPPFFGKGVGFLEVPSEVVLLLFPVVLRPSDFWVRPSRSLEESVVFPKAPVRDKA